PNQFVIKTTHDQGGVVVCKDKSNFDYHKAKQKLNKHLRVKHYYLTREWPYKDVKPRIIAEEFLEDEVYGQPVDYKFFCFHGDPKVMFISTERQQGTTKIDFFKVDNFEPLDIIRGNGKSERIIEKPEQYELMVELARKVSENFPHLRVDFYYVNKRVLIGELTFFSGGGLKPFIPKKWDFILGEWINLKL